MRHQSQCGFTLIEVLVALFVLAIGVVGAGAAHLVAERTRQQAALTAEVAQLASSLAARMNANAPLANLPDAGNPYLSLDYDAVADGPPVAAAACFGSAACDPLALAARITANGPVARLPDAGNPYLSLDYDAVADGPPAAAPTCFGTAACDPLALAAFDLDETRLLVHGRFPGGRIAVCRDAAPWDAGSRRYRWACSGGAHAAVAIKIGWHGNDDAPAFVLMVAQ